MSRSTAAAVPGACLPAGVGGVAAERPRRGAPEAGGDRPRRLLAVDDNADSAELIVRVAERCGYLARFTTDSTEVDRLIQIWKPDVLVTDISMPQLDAIELITVLKCAGFGGDLMLVSGLEPWMMAQAAKLAAMHGLDVSASLQKPVDVRRLRVLLTDAAETAVAPRRTA